jgi:predicted component of type VI protein secretion system
MNLISAAVASIERFSLHTRLLDDVTRSNIKRWLSRETQAKATVEKDLSFLRSYNNQETSAASPAPL